MHWDSTVSVHVCLLLCSLHALDLSERFLCLDLWGLLVGFWDNFPLSVLRTQVTRRAAAAANSADA